MNAMNNETFPFVDAIESEILPAFLINRTMWVDLKDSILSQYWTKKERSIIFKMFSVFFERYKSFPTEAQAIDMATRKNYGLETINEIIHIYNRSADNISTEEQQYLYDECMLFIKNNKIKTALLESVDLLDQGNFLSIESTMKDAVNWNPDVNLGTDIADVEKRFAALEQLSDNVIPSPWKSLNQLIGGGFFGKELNIFAGSSSVGKSIALDNIAYNAWDKGYNVVVITLELSEVRKAQRIDAAATKTSLQEVKTKKDEIIKFFEDKDRKNKLFIKEFPTNSISSKHIMNYLYQLELYQGLKMRGKGKGTGSLDLLVVDYLELVQPDSKKTNEYEAQGAVGAELRAIGQELDVPVVTACLHPHTIVITPEGPKRMMELQIGDKVLSKNAIFNTVKNHCIYLAEKPKPRSKKAKIKKYKITTKSGRTIICSKNHLFPVAEQVNEISVETGLKVGNHFLTRADSTYENCTNY